MAQRNARVSLKPGKSRAALTITHPNAAGRGWPSSLSDLAGDYLLNVSAKRESKR